MPAEGGGERAPLVSRGKPEGKEGLRGAGKGKGMREHLVAGLAALGEDVGHDGSVGAVVVGVGVRGGGHRRLRGACGGFVRGLSLAGGERTPSGPAQDANGHDIVWAPGMMSLEMGCELGPPVFTAWPARGGDDDETFVADGPSSYWSCLFSCEPSEPNPNLGHGISA